MRSRRILLTVPAALAAAALITAPARAVTIGSLDLPAGGLGSLCSATCTAFQAQVSPATAARYTMRVPADGTLTGWSYRNGNVQAGNTFALRVLRPNLSETQFTPIATVAAPVLSSNADAVRGPYPASVAVKAGDRIGLQARGPYDYGIPLGLTGQNDPSTGDGVGFFAPDVGDAVAGTPASAGNSGQIVLVQAQIDEPSPPPPGPAPRPDFQVGLSGHPSYTFSMGRRDTLTVPVEVRRNDLSRGPIDLTASGLPPGLTASFQAARLDATGTVLDPLTITGSASAPPAPGRYFVTITATPADPAAGPSASAFQITVNVVGQLDLHVHGIEVTQSVQTYEQPDSETYDGVPLVAGKKTVAKVFVGLQGSEATIFGLVQRPPVGVTLSGTDASGHALPGSPLLPEWSPPVASLPIDLGAFSGDTRLLATSAYTFVLPRAWTTGTIGLHAAAVSANLPSGQASNDICTETSCGATPTRELRGVAFLTPPRTVSLSVLGLNAYLPGTTQPLGALPPASLPFTQLMAMSPVPFRWLEPDGSATDVPIYRAIWSAPSTQLLETTQAFDQGLGNPGDGAIGLFSYQPGNGITVSRDSVGTVDRDAKGNVNRPVTIVAHELFHQLGLHHADSACGGGGDGKPDAFGRSLSVGIDTSGAPPYRVIADQQPADPAYDVMSYCGVVQGDPRHWISVLNWDRLLGRAPARAALPVLRAAAAPGGLSVLARAGLDGGATITSVMPTAHGTAGPAGSPYALVARDAAGGVLSTTPLLAAPALDAVPPYISLSGTAPAPDRIATLEVVSQGAVLASVARSAHAPAVTISAPRAGAHVGRRGSLAVGVRASDADGDPLTLQLDVSADGGRTFRTVYGGPATVAPRIPVDLLPASRRVRLRAWVTDGFAETPGMSGTFTVASRAPEVTIAQPRAGSAFDAGGIVFLQGAARDDQGHAIAASHLRWTAGRRDLGHGAQLTVALPAGVRSIALHATDARGRTGTATVRMRTRAVRAFFTRLRAPARASRRARAVKLVVATTQPATLRAGGRRYAVGRTARSVRVRVSPGRKALALRLSLSSGGLTTTKTVTVARR